jgi:hypothetical protein
MTATDALELIASLSKRDRAWILRNLSEGAQRSLRERASSERVDGECTRTERTGERGPSREDGPAGADERAVEWLEGEQVAAALAGEPPWVVAMLLGLRSWQWEAQMLMCLAPMTRLEVSQLRLSAPRVSDGMRRLLLRSLRARVAGLAAVSPNGFERLLQGNS